MRTCVTLTALLAILPAAGAQADPLDAGTATRAVDGGYQESPEQLAHDAALRAQILQEVQQQEDAKLAKMREELRDEMRAEMTTAGAPPQEFEQLPEEKPRLNFFELDGYYRLRPTLYQDLWLGWTRPDPLGYYLAPKPYSPNGQGKTDLTADMRLQLDPTINVSEDVRIKMQIDVFDNLVLGSTSGLSYGNPFIITSETQVPPSTVTPSYLLQNSVQVKRVWAEVTLPPVGQLRFGRMGSNWGLGIYQNDGNCLDCDYGNTVDRIMLILKIANHYFIPMIDWLSSGPLYNMYANDPQGQPYAFDRLTGAYRYVLEIARKDSPEELRKTLEAGKTSINYGFWGQYRSQANDLIYGTNTGIQSISPTVYAATGANPNANNYPGGAQSFPVPGAIVARNANFWVPDVWARVENRKFRVETELTYINGSYLEAVPGIAGSISTNPPALGYIPGLYNHQVNLSQFGAALESEMHLLPENALTLQLYAGVATGNGGNAHGFGNQPGRGYTNGVDANGRPVGPAPPGTIDATSIYCPNGTEPCPMNTVNAFNFNRDYRIDQVLWRQILGGVVDAWYVRPGVKYRIIPGLEADFATIYSQAMLWSTTPGQHVPLGLEFDFGLHYQTDDSFIAWIDYGVMIPFEGLGEYTAGLPFVWPSVAQAVRLTLAVKF
jgi:uncharacterized protein (TIGR04551 family)